MEIELKPLVFGPGFLATNMEKPKVAVSTPSQNSRAGDDGNRGEN